MANLRSVTDLFMASFLLEKEIKPVKVSRDGSKGTWFYDIDEETWMKLKIEFDGSSFSKDKMLQNRVKDMLY